MTIDQAKKLYLAVCTDSSENYFNEEDWGKIRNELLAVVSANNAADAMKILKQKGYGKPEQCAQEFRKEWARMNGLNYVASDLLVEFIRESNRIEGIEREPIEEEIEEMKRFLALPEITVADLEHFVSVYEPSAMLREHGGMNVLVGNHVPPRGGPKIREELSLLLKIPKLSAYDRHVRYETLHPFTDCNGCSGRALWLWDMKGKALLGFLQTWYYQSLDAGRK